MNKKTIQIVTILAILAASPASAWFWDKEEVKTHEKKEVSQKPVAGDAGRDEGFFDLVKGAGRDIRLFFRDLGKGTKKSSKKMAKELKQVPGELKKESKSAAKSIKDADRKIGREAKKGAKSIGKAFRQLGRDVKDSTKEVYTDK
jgi:hypothetical protein